MSVIKKYTKKDGSLAYMFNVYLGVDPLTGKKKRTTRRGFNTQKEAKIALSKILVEVDDYGLRSDENVTFEMVYQEWFKQHSKEIKATTRAAIESKFKKILPKFGHLKIKDIKMSYCQKVINEWAQDLKTFNDYKIQANLVFKYAIKTNILKVSPMEHVTLPKQQNKLNYVQEEEDSKKFYSRDELKAFLEAATYNIMVYAMFRLLAFSGARKGEIYALHWNDINFQDKTVHFRKTLSHVNGKRQLQTTKTTESKRIISLDNKTLNILKKWRKEQIQMYMKLSIPFQTDDKQPVFTMYNQKEHKFNYCRLAYLNDQLERIYSTHEKLTKITVHGFRHTHASLLFEAGASLKDVQARLGHTDIQTTMNIYTHVTNEAKEKTAEMFQKYMSF